MKIGEIFRTARPADPLPPTVDGYPNFYFHTATLGKRLVKMDKGINPIALVNAIDGPRRPAIVISSSPHKIGSAETPWQDFFDPDNGHVRYFGDNKVSGHDPALARGNKILLEAKRLQDAMEPAIRRLAPPILLFRRMRVGGVAKGFPAFQGLAVIERAELISQYNAKNDTSFPNYAFDFSVLGLSAEFEEFDWSWVSSRRDESLPIHDTLAGAPKSWRTWVDEGMGALPRIRRRVTKLLTTPVADQRPEPGSREAAALQNIYDFYEGRKHRFELLASIIVGRVLQADGGDYRIGWVTRPGSDGGADFVGRLDLGSGFSTVKQVVFGQAKCESPASTANGRDIARTVARLRRGWIGAFVTLGAFSLPVQREVLDDEYPIILVPGSRVAEEVLAASLEAGCSDIVEYLERMDFGYEEALVDRQPEEILGV